MKRAGNGWTLTIPGARPGTVSLRAMATGPAGSSVTQTIIDACMVKA